MTGPDLIRLAEELARCGGVHRLTTLVTAAVHVALEHEHRHRTVEDWEDGPCGVGMSDKAVGPPSRQKIAAAEAGMREEPGEFDALMAARYGAKRAPTAEEPSGGICEGVNGRGPKSIDLQTTAQHVCNPSPVMPDRGERVPLPVEGKSTDEWTASRPGTFGAAVVTASLRTGNALAEERGGIVHLPDSPIAAEFGPSDPARRRVPKPVDPAAEQGDCA